MPDDVIAFDHVLFYGREYDEVLSMVALTEVDLANKKILDCPSGPDAFVADATARGFDVTGCDPVYAQAGEGIVARGRADLDLALAQERKHPEQMGGIDIDAFHARKLRAFERFAADFEPGLAEGRYLPASLPALPFEDGAFDLVISANLLFTYSSAATGGIAADGTLDLEFHRRSVHELIRVCRGELRLYPVMTHRKSQLHPFVAQIIGQLAADGVAMTFVESTYNQSQFTGHLVLVIDCRRA
ncbi:MAG: hypothetical protein ACREKL_16930 [Chthoniobacterales bacterium]